MAPSAATRAARVVLVGVDGSSPAAEASVWAAWFAKRTGARLVLASAWLPQQSEGTPEDIAERRHQAALVLEREWSEPARSLGVESQTVQTEGPPESLLEVADAEGADLIVVGNRGTGGHAAFHVGSVAHRLAHHTARPLAIIPAPAARAHPEVVVVGVDGSPGAAAAVRWCAEAAPGLGARVVAVAADEPFLEWATTSSPKGWRQRLLHHAEEWVAPIRDAEVPVTVVVRRDIHPVAAIAETANEFAAQMIVVGTHRPGTVTDGRLGGVALQLVHRAMLPVVLVPRAWALLIPPTEKVTS